MPMVHVCDGCGRHIGELEDAPIIVDVTVTHLSGFFDPEHVPDWIEAVLAQPPQFRRRQLCVYCVAERMDVTEAEKEALLEKAEGIIEASERPNSQLAERVKRARERHEHERRE